MKVWSTLVELNKMILDMADAIEAIAKLLRNIDIEGLIEKGKKNE